MIERFVGPVKKWGGKAGLSIADQGIASGTNFALNVVLIRFLDPAEYGAFAIAFTIYLFLMSFHNAIILEPMSVIGPARYGDVLKGYMGATVWIHGAVSVVFVALLGASAAVAYRFDSVLAPSLLGLSIAVPFMLLFLLIRRGCYLEVRPGLALRGSLVYFAILAISVFFMWTLKMFSPFSAFSATALAGLGGSLILWRPLGVTMRGALSGIGGVFARHWDYGRWVMGSAFVYHIVHTVYVPLVGSFAGLAQAGVFRAMQTLTLPFVQTQAAMGALLLPWVSKRRAQKGDGDLWSVALRTSGVMLIAATGFVACILFAREPIVRTLYSNEFYMEYVWLIAPLGLVVMMGSAGFGFATVLRAAENPRAVFLSQATGAALTLTVGIGCILVWKVWGAAVGQALSALGGLIVMVYCCRDHLRKRRRT